MEGIISLVQFARRSILAVIIVIVVAVFAANSWTKHTHRLIYEDNLFRKGQVEVVVEGMCDISLPSAEADAKRKALELANGIFVDYQLGIIERGTSTMTADSSDFSHEQTSDKDMRSSGEADFVSIDYLERRRNPDGMFYVKIRAVVKSRHLSL